MTFIETWTGLIWTWVAILMIATWVDFTSPRQSHTRNPARNYTGRTTRVRFYDSWAGEN